MSSLAGSDEERRAIPRWRMYRLTVGTGELGSLAPAAVPESPELALLRAEFEVTQELFVGADYIEALVVHRRADLSAVERVIAVAERHSAPEALTSFLGQVHRFWLAGAVANTSALQVAPRPSELASVFLEANALVGSSRRHLHAHSRDAMAWVDLALGYATLGLQRQAHRAMRTAIGLAPDNRFVLRSAARMYVHFDEPDRAHAVVSQSSRHLYDPWLLAAEHAAAQLAFGHQKNSRAGREMVASGDFSPMALSELASELGTDEVDRGHDKRARALFDQALTDPTENAVAQAASVVRKSGIRVAEEKLSIDGAFEARSLDFASHGMWEFAAAEATKWFRAESFSIAPVLFGSFVASLGINDNELAIRFAEVGLRTHPFDPFLHNNAAFALAQLGKVDDARGHLAIARSVTGEVEQWVSKATEGLVEFRSKNFIRGRELYRDAIRGLEKSNHLKTAATASVLYATEELIAGVAPDWPRAVEVARRNVEKFPSPEGETVLSRLEETVKTAFAAGVKRGAW